MSNGKLKKNKVVFNLNAPEARHVFLAGDFNEWRVDAHPLRPHRNGNGEREWRTTLQLQSGAYQYRYIVDGEWRNDPAGQERIPNEFGTFNDIVRI